MLRQNASDRFVLDVKFYPRTRSDIRERKNHIGELAAISLVETTVFTNQMATISCKLTLCML